ncbi:erylysin B [Flagelloscypha sp. PMI_526]|nr:erylysin B [Flagelloscypha sp. PMI_526]
MQTTRTEERALAAAHARFQDDSTEAARPSLRAKRAVAASSERQTGDTLNDVIADPVRRNKLIDDNNLLKGIIMTPDGPLSSSRECIERPDALHSVVNNVATIETTTVEVEFTQKLMESNYNSVSVKVSAPYVTATAEYSKTSTWKNDETQKSMYMSSRYLFPHGRIDFSPPGSGFDGAVKLSSGFTNAIQNAIGKSSLSDRREALYTVFEQYGHVFRTKVKIGGVLSAHTQETFKRTENETEVKQDVKASLEGAVKNWGGGVTVGHGNTSSTITTAQNRKLDTKYIVHGGDYTKIQKTEDWIASTDKSEYWRAIEVTEAVPLVDMLPDEVSSEVKLLLRPLLGKWVDVQQVEGTSQLPVAIYRPKDPIPSGWFWLGQSADGTRALIVKPTLPYKAGRNPALTGAHPGEGLTDQPFVDLPQYQFLSTYFGGFVYSTPPGSLLKGLRPDLGLPGYYESHGENISTAVYITRPVSAADPADKCLDLKSAIRVKLPGSGNPPKPTWALREDMVLFNSNEE